MNMQPTFPKPIVPSLYAATARAPVATLPLAGDLDVSVAVVGAGFTGLSTALHLAEAGVDVAVIDANEPGWGASGRNGGQVNPGFKHTPDEMEAEFGPDLGARMTALCGNAPTEVFGLVKRLGIDCEAANTGTIRAVVTERFLPEVEAAYEQWSKRQAPVEWLDKMRIAAETGTGGYLGALLDRRGGSLNPLGYARGLAEAAQKAGARILSDTPALGLERQGSRWKLKTPRGEIRSEKIVIGTNGYTDALWPKLEQSIVPVYSAIAATEPLSPEIAKSILPNRAVVYENSRFYGYYRVDRAGHFLLGARGALHDTSDPAEYGHIIARATTLFPALARAQWRWFWNGQVAITADRYPHVHEPAPGIHIGLGYNGRGVAMATAMGRMLAKRVAGGAAKELDLPVTDIKAVPFHAFWRMGVRIERLYGQARDALGL
jgi:glycine/D-amino acid oxidase-like deaminating enzyme